MTTTKYNELRETLDEMASEIKDTIRLVEKLDGKVADLSNYIGIC